MFQDKRSKKIILLAHCILNQNAKIDGCAHYPGGIAEVVQAVLDSGAGIVQLPCPELHHLGLDRKADEEKERTIESEDTRVADLMRCEESRDLCRRMADFAVQQVEEYRKNGFSVMGLIGIDGSPTCAVSVTWADDQDVAGQGVFVEALVEGLAAKNIQLPMVGIRARDKQGALDAVRKILG